MESFSSKTPENVEGSGSETPESVEAGGSGEASDDSDEPYWLKIPKLRGNLGRLFPYESSPFDMNSDEFDSLVIEVEDIRISDNEKPKPPPQKRTASASKDAVERLPTILLENDRPDWKCSICLGTAEKGEEWLELLCSHTIHLNCGKDSLARNNTCPICRAEMLTGDATYDSWLIKKAEREEEEKGSRKPIKGPSEYMYV